MKIQSGTRFGRLTAISDKGPNNVECLCDCGTVKTTTRKNLRRGDTKSCGCLHREFMEKTFVKHGEHNTRLYRIWKGIRTRATNKNRRQSKDYVLRGITVCEEWSDFRRFKDWSVSNGYSENLTIDRVNNDGPYSPDNCRWITQKEQCKNKRNTRIIFFGGKEYRTIRNLCEACGFEYRLVQSRLRSGWTIEESVNMKKCKSGPRKNGQKRSERMKD